MDLHGPNSRVDARIDRALKEFESSSFTSAQFIERFLDLYPKTWAAIIERYGLGGKGTGTVFTSSSFIGRHLEKRKYNRSLLKLDRVRSPAGWGNPWITVWANLSYSGASLYPDEIQNEGSFLEGAKTTVVVNKYERDNGARKRCIEHYGTNCSVCRMSFGKMYGSSLLNFIHVHHLKPLSTIGKQYKLDPIKDLRPVCPNCHAVIHANGKVLSITQARAAMRHAARENSN
ncbi:HNH endonuclease [uncultured Methylobacterium sp.]|uniref:HNH endonuclease n=1 Tax=uncultured Methylobacterium sp. TaxID=157278 RepID=UPI0035CB29BD